MLSSPPTPNLTHDGMDYVLEWDSPWYVKYRSGKELLILSKPFFGTFDWTILEKTQPADLAAREIYPAAAALYVCGADHEKIPQVWREFAADKVGPGAAERMRADHEAD
ncbi:MAG: hypothetical protein EOP88_07725 [Verrucomicrobiaceae bacterium]|nr:MAG: hypothetical protein EOP88_07725 [Verrucomicrobiaceae bacterium]